MRNFLETVGEYEPEFSILSIGRFRGNNKSLGVFFLSKRYLLGQLCVLHCSVSFEGPSQS